MAESILNDLNPRDGLEYELVEQIIQTVWRMRRAQHMQDGLALKRIQSRIDGENLIANTQAGKAYALVEPFEALQADVGAPGRAPAAEIADFVESQMATEVR